MDKGRIGVSGMNMGCTRAWWLAAIDDRAKAVVGRAGFTRSTELIAHANRRKHGTYDFVPGVLAHFGTEAIFALVAPGPMPMLSGGQDGGAPTDGFDVHVERPGRVYQPHGRPGDVRSAVYEKSGHEYLPERKADMLAWFGTHLPVGSPDSGAGSESRKSGARPWAHDEVTKESSPRPLLLDPSGRSQTR